MRDIKTIFLAILLTSILAGCSDLTNALSGIDGQAQKAASGLTPDALSARSITIEYKNERFTVDELFTSILRDIFWEYDKNNDSQILTVKGTWKEGLFGELDLPDDQKANLITDGKVTTIIEFEDNKLLTEKIKVEMTLNDNVIVDESGEKALEMLHEAYKIR